MKLLRTIRFDASDERVFELAAAPEEWAVSGAFAFAGLRPGDDHRQDEAGFRQRLSRRRQLRPLDLRHGGRGDGSRPRRRSSRRWPCISYRRTGLPGSRRRCPRREEEARFVADLCRDAPINTVFTVRRTWDADGRIKEEFRTIRPPTGEPLHARIWTVVDD